jgi:hypothetical protein
MVGSVLVYCVFTLLSFCTGLEGELAAAKRRSRPANSAELFPLKKHACMKTTMADEIRDSVACYSFFG